MLDGNGKPVLTRATMKTDQASHLGKSRRQEAKTQFRGQGIKVSEPAMLDQNETCQPDYSPQAAPRIGHHCRLQRSSVMSYQTPSESAASCKASWRRGESAPIRTNDFLRNRHLRFFWRLSSRYLVIVLSIPLRFFWRFSASVISRRSHSAVPALLGSLLVANLV
jgi:hypothetical protein